MAADIRPARASDVDALLAIENAVFPTDRLSGRSFRRLIGSPSVVVLVADAGKRVAGYVVLLFRAGSTGARLYSIAAAPDHSGQGTGRALMAAAEREAARRGRSSLRLEVREDNARAIAIYRRAGFEPTGRQPDYYEDGMAAFRMKKELGGEAVRPARRGGKQTLPARARLARLADKIPGRA